MIFIIIGGGIAGTSCIEFIKSRKPNDKILLFTTSNYIKDVLITIIEIDL